MSTDFTRKNRQYRSKKPQDDKVVIDAGCYEQPERPIYLCDYCHCSLTKLNEEGEYWCNKCSISFMPNANLRTASILETPEGPDRDVFVSYTPDPDDLIGKPVEIKGTFKTLQDKGLHKHHTSNTML